jgi:5'(3')-deoxyribonucleotidase
MSFTLALDCDGVLFDFNGAFAQRVNECVPVRNTPPGVPLPPNWVPNQWDVKACPHVQAAQVNVASVYADHRFARAVKPYAYAAHLLSELAGQGLDLVFVTSPMHSNPEWCYHRRNACAALCAEAGLPTRPVVFTDDKTRARFDLLIDDKPETVHAVNETPGAGVAVLFRQPWNRIVPDGAFVVDGWRNLVRLAYSHRSIFA